MTKEELVKMMGDEDKANWVMEIILDNVKPDFVRLCLKVNAKKAEKKYCERVENGYYNEFSEFPEGFNLWREPENSLLSQQWDMDTQRKIEECGDKQTMIFAKNMYAHAMSH